MVIQRGLPWTARVLEFYYYAVPGQGTSLAVGVVPDGDTDNLKLVHTINYSSLSGNPGWRKVVVDLSEFTNTSYILLTFIGTALNSNVGDIAFDAEGDKLNCLLPLGNSFTIPSSPNEKFLLVGGGVGVAPLLYLGHKIHEMGGVPTFLLGARSAHDLLEIDRFRAVGRVFLTTEDGSEGERGFVTGHSILNNERFDHICTCGPKPMMQAVARYAVKSGTECEVSLENLMACGLGACLCCVEKTTEGNVCVCKEGPVFNIKKLLWQI